MSKYRTHSEIIDAIRLKCARAYWSEDSLHPNGDIPEIKCLEPHKLATLLESAHKREVDDLKKQIALLSKTPENDNSATATITTVKQETLADIVNEIRARAGAWPDEKLKQYDLRLADRIEVAAMQEAAKLIPAKNIEFSDGNGRRQVSQGWVKVGGKPLASRPATKQDMEADKAKWCFVCTTDCPLRGSDVLMICGHFKKSEVSV